MSTIWAEQLHDSQEYEVAYEIVRYAMTLVADGEVCSKLSMLKNVLYKADTFVNDELDDLPEEAAQLGLDKWREEEREWEEGRDCGEEE